MNRSARSLFALVSATGVMLAGVSPATADRHRTPTVETVATGLAGPLQIDLGRHGDVVVGQAFAGLASRVSRDGVVTTLTADPDGVEGVAVTRDGVAYTQRVGDFTSVQSALVKRWHTDGTTETVADLLAFEQANNPDQGNTYGFTDLDPACLAQVPAELQSYPGGIDSHPYALLAARHGWYVADAGANALFLVDEDGGISTVAVFAPQEAVVTADAAAGLGLPDCVVGATYAFEPVPTDVEYDGRHGLLVSLLPGGPEDASLGARGSVVRVSAHRHHDLGHRHGDHHGSRVEVVATGLLGATNVAVGRHGRIFVSELFGNQISRISRQGEATPVLSVPSPAALEYSHGWLVATADVFGAGNLVRIRVG